MKKKVIITTVVVGIIIILIIANLASSSGLQVQVEKVKRGVVKNIVSAPGTVESPNEVNISSDVMGKLVKLYVEEGDTVKEGNLLAKLDDTEARANYEKAKSFYESQKANYQQKKEEFQRKKVLYEKGLISKKEFDDAKTALLLAENSLKQAESDVVSAKDRLDKYTIKSPISGIVTQVKVKEGENVITGTMNNPGTVLLTITNIRQMDMVADVDESEIPLVNVGDTAEISIDAFPDTVFMGIVYNITGKPRSTGESVSFPVRIEILNPPEDIFPGMSGDCDIVVEKKTNVLRIPIQALVSRKKKDGVFIVKDGKAVFTPVKKGMVGERYVEILEGVKEGDPVIIGPFKAIKEIKDGQRVSYRTNKGGSRVNKDK